MPPHILALNTAEGRLQMVIAKDDGSVEPRFAGHWHAPSQGAELLAPALRDACRRLRISPADIRRIAVVRGPGSFTGIRLALATASGLARATGAKLAGINYLPLLTASALDLVAPVHARPEADNSLDRAAPACTSSFFALTHARRALLHLQAFALDGQGHPSALTDIMVLDPQKAAETIADICMTSNNQKCQAALPLCRPTTPDAGANNGSPGRCLLFGSGLAKNREALTTALVGHGLPNAILLPPGFDHPSPAALLRAATAATYNCADIAPLYVRPSDAEDNLERIAVGLGLGPDAARQRLTSLAAPR